MKKETFTLTTGELVALVFIFTTTVASLVYAIPAFN